ncbi:hypothetical protein TVAG_319290 [Trichomonas vaginalis G3]|uniref:Uncharacterized protein n=1 Tax=Trichomonas vaginalis (strain ATCC PRA-98 / G3) TaxID=412133 RepID=A2FUN5_TRIV3|nr:hypothetical protein TVAGG3_0899840 [Trichomonas vaginalis G3]EAX91383.1 hypothetical protein TVAG_319290 [Trichomonas vaginalis G3]KAI5483609.1 hypothetical protein TVAGG3_0899840 [Trichomonas vaginalis G3]|eukprot:XP_001304313.1 hypothetical protein [Trichomonas vaginalis G3]
MFFSLLFQTSLCECPSDPLKLTTTGQHMFAMVEGSVVCMQATEDNTVLIFDFIGNATATVCINNNDGECTEVGKLGLFGNNTNITGIWFGRNKGLIEVTTQHVLTIKFTYAILPTLCDKMLITNTRNYTINISRSDLDKYVYFCFFAATYGTYAYKVSYNVSDDDKLHIIRKDNVPRNYGGLNRFSGNSVKDDPIVITLDTTNDALSSELTISLLGEDIIPDTNITTYLNGSDYAFLKGQFLNDFPPPEVDDKYSNIISITLIVIFAGCGVGCIIYRIVSYYKKKKMRELLRIERLKAPKRRFRKIIHNKPKNEAEPMAYNDGEADFVLTTNNEAYNMATHDDPHEL